MTPYVFLLPSPALSRTCFFFGVDAVHVHRRFSYLERDRGPATQRHNDVDVLISRLHRDHHVHALQPQPRQLEAMKGPD